MVVISLFIGFDVIQWLATQYPPAPLHRSDEIIQHTSQRPKCPVRLSKCCSLIRALSLLQMLKLSEPSDLCLFFN